MLMELIRFFRVLRRRWWMIVLPVVIVTAFVFPDLLRNGLATSSGYTTMFRYSAGQPPQNSVTYEDRSYFPWLSAELTVDALTAWVQSTSFAEEIAQKTAEQGAEIDPAGLRVAADNIQAVGQVFFTWPDEQQLQLIAEAAIDVLQTRTQAYFPQLDGQPLQVTILDTPRITPVPVPLIDRFTPFVRIVLGLLAGIGLAFLAEYLDPTLRYRDEVEALGLRVIATIPPD
jgi:capsular polysaccharide biosynthesis protein